MIIPQWVWSSRRKLFFNFSQLKVGRERVSGATSFLIEFRLQLDVSMYKRRASCSGGCRHPIDRAPSSHLSPASFTTKNDLLLLPPPARSLFRCLCLSIPHPLGDVLILIIIIIISYFPNWDVVIFLNWKRKWIFKTKWNKNKIVFDQICILQHSKRRQ